MERFSYGFSRKVPQDFQTVLKRAVAALKGQGFHILTQIDAQKEFREHLQLNFGRYIILGACNTLVAHKLLSTDSRLGLLLPCNVVVAETGDGCTVMAMDPARIAGEAQDPSLHNILDQVRERFETALAQI